MRKKTIIVLSSVVVALVVVSVCVASIASRPPPVRIGDAIGDPLAYFTALVNARPDDRLVDSYCGVSGDGHACTFGTHLNWPFNHYYIAAHRFTYLLDTNGTVTNITSSWNWHVLDF